MAELDYAGVSRFWSKARPSILGPYMMDDLDGILAGKLNIRSQFGAILDNVCDAVAHTVFVMLVPYRMPWQMRSLTKSATAVGLLNVSLVIAWLVPDATLPIAAAFLLGYLFSFAWGGICWIKGIKAGVPA